MFRARNTLSGQLRIIEHSQDIVAEQIKAQEQVFEETKAKYEANSSNKLLCEEHKKRKEILAESKRLFHQNQAEEARLRLNVELFNKRIENLKMPIKKGSSKNNQSKYFRTAQSQKLIQGQKPSFWKKRKQTISGGYFIKRSEKRKKSLKDIHKMATEKDY